MSRYAVKNLMDVEPVGDPSALELRFLRKSLESEQLGITQMRYAPGFDTPDGHRHKVQEEAYIVVEGSGTVKLDDERVEINQWDVVRISPEVVRGFAAGPDGLVLIAIGGPRPEEGDGVFEKGHWADESA
jgi:quercetin dioxygenase-like cupin family protein